MGQKKIVRAVLDTNVLASALLFGGKPGRLISMWKSGRLVPILSAPILREYLRVLAYPRFELTKKEIDYLLYKHILPYFEVIDVTEDMQVIDADPSDDKFLHCAVAGKADVLVSGDRHLVKLQTYQDIPILSPSRSLEKEKA